MTEFTVGVTLRSIGTMVDWWRDQAVRLEAAGYAGVWQWDHFVSRGVLTDPVLEVWTNLAFAAAATSRMTLGTYVVNVMNRHPAVLARMAATFQQGCGGRLVLGIGIGGHPAEHEAYAFPIPEPVPPIIIGGETTAGARLAARIGDGWTTAGANFEKDLPVYFDALAAVGRERGTQRLLVAFEITKRDRLAESPWVTRPTEEAARWEAAGADGAIVMARTTEDVDALIEAAGRR